MRRAGLSIGEGILSAFIIMMVVLTLFNLIPSSALAMRKAEMQIRADAIAQRLIEEQRAKPYKSLTLGTVYGPEETHRGVVYKTRVRVLAPTGNKDVLKGLRVRVAWNYQGRDYECTHESWLTHAYLP